jgi:hypothetical protein
MFLPACILRTQVQTLTQGRVWRSLFGVPFDDYKERYSRGQRGLRRDRPPGAIAEVCSKEVQLC